MRIFALILIISLGGFLCHATDIVKLPEIKELNLILSEKGKYESAKKHRLDSLKRNAEKSRRNDLLRFRYLSQLVDEYSNCDTDSTMKYAYELENTGERLGRDYYIQAEIYVADALSLKGMYMEAMSIMEKLKNQDIPDSLLVKWYDLNTRFYGSLGNTARHTPYRKAYLRLNRIYSDSLVALGTTGGDRTIFEQAQVLRRKKRYHKATAILLPLLAKQKHDGSLYGSTAYCLSQVKMKMGDTIGAIRYLAESAISDLVHGVRKTSALNLLAMEMHRIGKTDLAYRYVTQSLEDATAYGSQMRIYTVSSSFDIIKATYQQTHRRATDIQNAAFALAIALLAFMCLYAWKMWKDRKIIMQLNNQLKTDNDNKEIYLRHFIVMCSIYINKLAKYKLTVRRKINAGQIDELLRRGNDAELTEDEQKEFYKKFDSAFIHVYSDFVDNFNLLLKPGEQIIPNKGELNTELRIFALIKIGIHDSAKIASFLNLSITTIYTYRNKVKHRAISPDTFERDILA